MGFQRSLIKSIKAVAPHMTNTMTYIMIVRITMPVLPKRGLSQCVSTRLHSVEVLAIWSVSLMDAVSAVLGPVWVMVSLFRCR